MGLKNSDRCEICDLGTPAQLIQYLNDCHNPLARLDWETNDINGPRLMALTPIHLRKMFSLDEEEVLDMMEEISVLKEEHEDHFLNSE